MTRLNSKIKAFYKLHNEHFKVILEAVISNMLDSCRYTNGESLERHNWGDRPIKLNHIPKNIYARDFDSQLMRALDSDDNEKAIIELLWGDPQLGKRIQALIIMWISIYVLQRPVIYLFRNLGIDFNQLQNDILVNDEHSFNIKYIKKIFKSFNDTIIKNLNTEADLCWDRFALPGLKDLRDIDHINRIEDKDSINSTDIFAGLINVATLEKLNNKLTNYIVKYCELANFTLIIDEGDLVSPTASNDSSMDTKDCKDSTQQEKLIAVISKKVRYSLKITGTAHSLLYNCTTRLGHDNYIHTKISKVHKMRRVDKYFGIMNSGINFNTDNITAWWDSCEPKKKYTLKDDYLTNIKTIITTIVNRNTTPYNSFLISEEKTRHFQFDLVYNHILKDFPDLFLIVFHGKCLNLYFNKLYTIELLQASKKDSISRLRLHQEGGIYKQPYNTYEDGNEEIKYLPNNYCYYKINIEKFNIKMVYKVLRMLFLQSTVPIINKTVITITGKYGERGYSFTSDNYGEYAFHLTDQYLVSHASFNCTDIAQRVRLQGKYEDKEKMSLTLWTTPQLKDIVQNFYIPFIKYIEKDIMNCNSYEEIQDLIENIIDNGQMKFGKYMKYLDVAKKRKNICAEKRFDRANNGHMICTLDDFTDEELIAFCEEFKLPSAPIVNTLKQFTPKEFDSKIARRNVFIESDLNSFEAVLEYCKEKELAPPTERWLNNRKDHNYQCIMRGGPAHYTKEQIENDKYEGLDGGKIGFRRVNVYRDNYHNIKFMVRYNEAEYTLSSGHLKDKDFTKLFVKDGDDIIYSEVKKEYSDALPPNYYYRHPSGWLYLHLETKQDILTIDILRSDSVSSSETGSIISDTASQVDPDTPFVVDSKVTQFATACCSVAKSLQLRFGIAEVFAIYKDWCKKNSCKHLNRALFKEHFEHVDSSYREDKSKGVDIRGKSGKRGYNIMVELK
jgi:hypothetical protein